MQMYDDSVVHTTLSLSKLNGEQKKDLLIDLDKIKTQNLIHKNNIQDIVDMAKLNSIEAERLKTQLTEIATTATEAKVVDTLTREELESALASVNVTTAKRQEILARYDNAKAAGVEASSVDTLSAKLKVAGAGIKETFNSLAAFLGKHPILTIVGATVGLILGANKVYEEYLERLDDKLKESTESSQQLTDEVAELEDQIKGVAKRIKELEAIGAPTLVEDEELKKLKETNGELLRELQIKENLQKLADKQAEDDAMKRLRAENYMVRDQASMYDENGITYHSGSWDEYVTQLIDDYHTLEAMMEDAEASGSRSADHYKGLMETQLATIQETFGWIEGTIIPAIGEDALTGEAQAFLDLWVEMREVYNGFLNDITDAVVGSPSSGSGGTTANLDEVITGEQLNAKLSAVIEKYKLLKTLQDDMKSGGKISADSLEGIVEQFSGLDQAVSDYHQGLITADALVQKVASAYQTAVDGYNELGGTLDVSDLLAEESEIQNFSEQLTGIVDKFDLLRDAQEAFSENGILTASTLSSIVEQFPAMEESVALYVAGMKSGKDLLADLTDAYRKDEAAWKANMKAKLYASTEFCNNLSDKQSKLIDALAESYGVDLDNFRTIEEAKADIQAQIIQHLAENYARYANATLEDLKARLELLKVQQETIQAVDINGNTDHAHQQDVWLARKKEIAALLNAIRDIEGAYKGLDEILMESWDPSKFIDLDDAEDEFEKFKAKWEDWFSDMEFKVNLKYEAGDLDGANKLYQQMVDKAQELLNDAYAEGMTIDDDWVQDLITKVNTYKKALADLRIEEYDKLIEYNDKFDVWNHVSYTKLDKLKEKLEAINEQYITGLMNYQEWHDAFIDTAGDIYDIQRDALEELLETQIEAIKAQKEAQIDSIEAQRDVQVDAIEEQIEAFDKIIERRKRMLEDARDEADYEQEVAKRVREVAKLQERISQLALDNSREATAERLALEEELYAKQQELESYMNDYSTDAALDALDEQREAFEESKDGEIDAAEDAAEEQLKILEDQLDDEVALRQQAIEQIDRDYAQMMLDIRGYFESLGITIDEELLDKLREGLDLVSQFGSYDGADSGISTNVGGLSTSSVASLVQQMKNNSAAWHNGDDAEKARLAAENERIAELLEAMGYDIWKDAAEGVWYIKIDGKTMRLFEKFHTGGVAGMVGTPKSDEIFALLRKGEVILNEDQQSSLLNIFNNAGKWMQNQMSQTIGAIVGNMRGRSMIDDGRQIASFAPNIEVNIHHNGNMTDADARRYGNQVATAALDHLWSTLNKRGIT